MSNSIDKKVVMQANQDQVVKYVDQIQLLFPADYKNDFPVAFTNVRVYGTSEDPLFVANDVALAIGIKDLHLRERFDDTDKVKIMVNTPQGKRETWALTEKGLYRAIYTAQTDLSSKFRTFIAVVLKELRLRGQITLRDAITKLEEKFREEKRTIEEKLNAKINMLDHQLVETNNERKKQAQMADYYFRHTQTLEEELHDVNTTVRNLEKTPGSTQLAYMERLKARYMKTINVILVKPPKELEDTFEYDPKEEDARDDEQYVVALSPGEFKDGQIIGQVYIHPEYKLADLQRHLQSANFGIKKPVRRAAATSDDDEKDNPEFYNNRFQCSLEELRTEIDDEMERFLH